MPERAHMPLLSMVFAIVYLLALVCSTSAANSKPNVLILLADDVGWGDVGYNCHNDTVCPKTPNIDALATGPHAVLFHRFYAGAGVCSPTRASVLTGRSNKRGCIDSALPCDHMASGAANCSQGPGLSWNEWTIAHAATKAGVPSLHLGKWHLGDLWDKQLPGGTWPPNQPHRSSPSDHGFTHWSSSQSQLPTSTPNCGCFPPADWQPPAVQPPSLNRSTAGMKFDHTYPGTNCVIGGGVEVNESYVCSTYWHPDTTAPIGVAPAPDKIVGDDGAYMVDQLDAFVNASVANATPFLATLWLHYIHLPHPAMPVYYAMYDQDPDYVGALAQMDSTVGDMVSLLQTHHVFNNTLLFFTSDNGCHCSESTTLWPDVHCGGIHIGRSSGGLRGCKASNWEGGIRVPGFMVWPDRIQHNVQTLFPAVTHDFLPTILDAWNMTSDHPERPLDGISLLPFANAAPLPERRTKPIGFWWGGSMAWIDNDLKLVAGSISPGQGCVLEPPYANPNPLVSRNPISNPNYNPNPSRHHHDNDTDTDTGLGPFLYNLTSDPTESVDLKTTHGDLFQAMTAALQAWTANVSASAALNGCHGATPPGPPSPPSPPPPPPGPVGPNCTFQENMCGGGGDNQVIPHVSLQQCCDACRKLADCTLSVFEEQPSTAAGTCHIKHETKSVRRCAGYWACRARNRTVLADTVDRTL
eukprot:m.11998 g.11998  ORF g.11998 m.11998 type:complete len:695 (+) comp2898_c0_seq1:231-2315(+)